MAYLSVDADIQKKNNGIRIEDLEKYLQSLASSKLSVGVHADKGQEMVKRAVHTEFGTTKFLEGWETPFGWVRVVPPRPAIRMYLYKDMKDEINTEYQLAINGEKKTKLRTAENSANKTLQRVGQECVFMQRDKMANGNYDQSTNNTGLNPEKNGIRTINYKGFDDPWVQTGNTISAVDYKIEKGK